MQIAKIRCVRGADVDGDVIGDVVNRVEAQFDPDARQVQRRVARDHVVDPAGVGAGVEINQALVLLDDRVLSDRGSGKVIQLLSPAVDSFGAWR